MKLKNCKFTEIEKEFSGKRIIVFGLGDYFKYYVSEHMPECVWDSVHYMIDSNPETQSIQIRGTDYSVKHVSEVGKENDCIILIASTNHMLEMFEQLSKMGLPDTVLCYSFGLIMAASSGEDDPSIAKIFFDDSREQRIPKTIHTFWFSGDEKPEEYKRCIESWYKYCPDYEIIEWNSDNYDYKKNTFMEDAINSRKWAFASDYARLDVIWEYGGIYLDADIELTKPLEAYLGNKAFFIFDSNNNIDLALIASEKNNPIINEIREIYRGLRFDPNRMNEFVQPMLIGEVLKSKGVSLDGNMQMIDDNIFLPRCYFSPLDFFVYEMLEDEREPIGIHHCNSGWNKNGYKKNRIENNRRLISILQNEK